MYMYSIRFRSNFLISLLKRLISIYFNLLISQRRSYKNFRGFKKHTQIMMLNVVISTWIWCMYKLDLRQKLLWEVGTNIRIINTYAEGTRSHIECLIYISLFNLIAFLGFKTNNGIPILGVKKSTSSSEKI